MSERHLVISSDCHAGLPNVEYRDYLESKYHQAFDDFMVQRAAIRTQGNIMGNAEFEEEWFGEEDPELLLAGARPHTRKALAEAFWDIPADDTDAILGLNAAEFSGFDTEALAPLVDRIGPTPEELGQTDSAEASQKWEALAAAGRPWITGVEAVPLAMD